MELWSNLTWSIHWDGHLQRVKLWLGSHPSLQEWFACPAINKRWAWEEVAMESLMLGPLQAGVTLSQPLKETFPADQLPCILPSASAGKEKKYKTLRYEHDFITQQFLCTVVSGALCWLLGVEQSWRCGWIFIQGLVPRGSHQATQPGQV